MISARLFFCALLFALLSTVSFGDVVINEIRIDMPGSDDDEYFELSGDSGESLDGLTYIVIGDSGAESGIVEAVIELTGLAISGSGYFVAAEGTFTLAVANLTTTLNFENSDNVSHILVQGFSGSNGDDLDIDDDGVLDVTPWVAIIDCVSFIETDPAVAGDPVYCGNQIGPNGSFVPGHLLRCPDSTGDWSIGQFTLGANDSPGTPNDPSCPENCSNGVDDDGDGLIDCNDDDCAQDPACGTPPDNDECLDAQLVSEGDFPFSNIASVSDGPSPCGLLLNDIWLRYTATCDGSVTLTTCGTTNFNPSMAVYLASGGCPPAAGTEIACDAGSCPGTGDPEIIFTASAGEEYLIQIGGSNGEYGDGTLTIECPPDDCHVFPNPGYELLFSDLPQSSATSAAPADITDIPLLDTVIITGGSVIADLDVAVDISMGFIGDLVIDVISPSGTAVRLHNENGGANDDIIATFDDEGATNGTVPFNENLPIQPSGPGTMADFDGENSDGLWALSIVDVFLTPGSGTVSGTLNSWSVFAGGPQEIPDGDPSGTPAVLSVPVANTDGILDLDVTLQVQHPDLSDLEITLESPNGTSVRLHDHSAGVNIDDRYDDDPAQGGPNDGYGTAIPDGPGSLGDFDGSLLAGNWTMTLADTIGGDSGFLQGWALLICAADCTGPTDLVCSSDCLNDAVSLSWINGQAYGSVDVLRDGVTVATLAGDSTTFNDVNPGNGPHSYEVRGNCAVGAGAAICDVNHSFYNGETDIVLALEGLFDGGDTGTNDSGAALMAALEANGRTPLLVRADPDDFLCWLAPTIEAVWVAAGTYPTNFHLTSDEASMLGNLSVEGVAIYFESADHWGFNPTPSGFDDRDGVASGVIDDGDDSLTSVDGSDSGVGLDLSGLQNVSYTQDNATGNDYTDQLVPADGSAGPVDASGPNAGLIWNSDDVIGTPYGVGIFYSTNTGGDTICASMEFGGLGGDRDALMGLYLLALGLGGVGDQFDRADCNSDGSFNIADCIYLLALLFSGGPEGTCPDACDINDDGTINIADAVAGLGNLFSGAANPPAPFGACGIDPTADALDCPDFPPCP